MKKTKYLHEKMGLGWNYFREAYLHGIDKDEFERLKKEKKIPRNVRHKRNRNFVRWQLDFINDWGIKR